MCTIRKYVITLVLFLAGKVWLGLPQSEDSEGDDENNDALVSRVESALEGMNEVLFTQL